MSSSNGDSEIISISKNNNEDSNEQENIIVKETKISDVSKETQIELNNQTLFQFTTYIEKDKLVFKLAEIGVFAPYIYLKKLTLQDFQDIHHMFKSCDDLESVQKHILALFSQNQIKLTQENDDSITFNITGKNISKTVKIEIKGERKMATEKDDVLLKLYHIQKNEIKLMKEIMKVTKGLKEEDGYDFMKKVKEIFNNKIEN